MRLGKSIRSINSSARDALRAHSWPGNIRELRNVIERAVILEPSSEIQPGSLPDFEVESRLRRPEMAVVGSGGTGASTLGDHVIAYERDLIQAAVQQSGGDLTVAAEQLGLSLPALRFRMARLQLGTL